MNNALLKNIKSVLIAGGWDDSIDLLAKLEASLGLVPGLCEWIDRGSTLELRELCSPINHYIGNRDHRNAINGLDSARHTVLNRELIISPGLAKVAIRHNLTLYADYGKGIIEAAANSQIKARTVPGEYDEQLIELIDCYCVTSDFDIKLRKMAAEAQGLKLKKLTFDAPNKIMTNKFVNQISIYLAPDGLIKDISFEAQVDEANELGLFY